MKNIVGQPARKTDFFHRPNEVKKILDALATGSSIQIVAPRRVGKTSIMFHFIDSNTDYYFVFLDAEAIKNKNQYFKRIYKELLENELFTKQSIIDKAVRYGKDFLHKAKAIKILDGSIEMIDDDMIDYKDELIRLIKNIDPGDKKIIIQIDEFPEAILNIQKPDNGGITAAEEFLMSNRQFRQHPDIMEKVQFIYTGSISLNTTVKRMGMTRALNDIPAVEIGALSESEAIVFVNSVASSIGLIFNDEVKKYLFKHIGWLIPFHLQLMLHEINLIRGALEITNSDIDRAFEALMHRRNDQHFHHYVDRLEKLYSGVELKFCEEVLLSIAKESVGLDTLAIYNLAEKHNITLSYKSILEELEYDGYINNVNDKTRYVFNSAVLQNWWLLKFNNL